jgi:hypothetical protein
MYKLSADCAQRVGAEPMADDLGPERYAPRFRRSSERENDLNQPPADDVEGKIKQLVRREFPLVQPQSTENGANKNSLHASLNALLGRLAEDALADIDRVIRDLENVRDMLRSEGERVNREIAGYASLNHAAATAMKVISDSMKQWKGHPNQKPESGLESD